MQHSWYTASSDVKQLIVKAANPPTARSLCQLDDQSTELCRTRLQAADKYRICLDGANGAAECDGMSMFSQQQFLSAVPVNIKIFTEDPVQLTHEFYSQNYKLADEGFALALRKAKLMNTICAIIRPEFLLTEEAKTLPIPPYVDTTLLDAVAREYVRFDTDPQTTYESSFEETIVIKHKDLDAEIKIEAVYHGGHKTPSRVYFYFKGVLITGIEPFFKMIERDEFIDPMLKKRVRESSHTHYTIGMSMYYTRSTGQLNVFQVSRFLKIVFDLGYYRDATATIISVSKKILEVQL